MTKVKICGITREAEAHFAVDAGADALGFVFAPSKRKIEVEKAAEICAALPSHLIKIGVFVNESRENLKEIFQRVNLDYVQLHGDESPSFCESLDIPYFKAVSIKEKQDLFGIEKYQSEMVLVDSGKGPYRGGNGTTFNWDYMEGTRLPQQLILAGGLNPANVREAILKVRPYMVDVSSGVETDGKKDILKIGSFISEVKAVK
ncbi:phosphoribosylanthranilate isomerase [Bacillus sp. KH172YL63]|uniref:phosphoribosylanthranilate isomerase n=1 Tax=Bacillus sp. KH172YL63 TaxID=2709784 RepID=UPI0013E4FA2F|nr:phosphoribosylanthranilate isomerase [Bacillus sp. KH172YL63]BCB04347.1 N-(5'-phosphoribosyl)anthranilate isomerase [Bacillus sp. KH172YL63]